MQVIGLDRWRRFLPMHSSAPATRRRSRPSRRATNHPIPERMPSGRCTPSRPASASSALGPPEVRRPPPERPPARCCDRLRPNEFLGQAHHHHRRDPPATRATLAGLFREACRQMGIFLQFKTQADLPWVLQVGLLRRPRAEKVFGTKPEASGGITLTTNGTIRTGIITATKDPIRHGREFRSTISPLAKQAHEFADFLSGPHFRICR